MSNKFKVKKKLVSIALALALATQPLASLPMNVFAGTGKTGVYTLNGLKIKNIPSKKVWFSKSGAEICNLKLEGVPSGKTVVWSVIQGEDIATVDSNGVVKAKGTKGGKVSVLAKCDGMITDCSFEIGYFDTKKFASDLLKGITAMTENLKLVNRAGEEYKEYLNSLKAAVEQFSKLPDDQIAKYLDKLDKKEVEGLPLEVVDLSAEQVEKFSLDSLIEIFGDSTRKRILLECSTDPKALEKILGIWRGDAGIKASGAGGVDLKGGKTFEVGSVGSEEEKMFVLEQVRLGLYGVYSRACEIIFVRRNNFRKANNGQPYPAFEEKNHFGIQYEGHCFHITLIDEGKILILLGLDPKHKLEEYSMDDINLIQNGVSFIRDAVDYLRKKDEFFLKQDERTVLLLDLAGLHFRYAYLLGGNYLMYCRGVFAYFAAWTMLLAEDALSDKNEEECREYLGLSKYWENEFWAAYHFFED